MSDKINKSDVIKRIDHLLSLGRLMIAEATELKASLSPVQERASRKGLSDAQKNKLIERRYKTISRRKPS